MMDSTKLETLVQRVVETLYDALPIVKNIVNDLATLHPAAHALLVGGIVRDALLEIPSTSLDVDIEVYGIELQQLEIVLAKYGVVRTAGKSFGVLKIDGINIDWSIPRTDGTGRKPTVTYNPHATYQEAFARRDLTINAMGITLPVHENQQPLLIDPYNGLTDLANKILRSSHPTFFVQDPLRYFRVMQFAGRFQFTPDQQLYEIGATIDLTGISLDRIDGEFYKLFTLAPKPSLGIDWIEKTGRLKELMPEVHALIGVEQNPEWHPEGDVFEHTKQALDAAALQTYASLEDRYVLTLAALCHDLGKAVSSRVIDGKIRSWDHEITGVPLTQALLKRISTRSRFFGTITKLVRWHMVHINLTQETTKPATFKRLALELAPETNCAMLALLGICDKSGRNPSRQGPFSTCPEPGMKKFLEHAHAYGVTYGPEEAVLTGGDLKEFGLKGSALGKGLKHAYEIQIERGIRDKEKLIALIKKHLR